MEKEKKEEITQDILLPDTIEEVGYTDPRDLVIISQPKMGKGTILGDFTLTRNALVFDLEKGGYEYIKARKITTYPTQETDLLGSYVNYMKYRDALLAQKGKYKYLIIDGLSDLDALSELGGTLAYMQTIIGKKFNRPVNTQGVVVPGAKPYSPNDPNFRSVLTLPEGAGYMHTRRWFMAQVEIFSQIAPYRIYAAHVADKFISDKGKEEVVGAEIALTGQLKRIFASKVTALAKLTSEGNERYLNFEVLNDNVLAGSRAPQLEDKILISRKNDDKTITTFWDSIYKN
jgi:hypothetical protein